jgi:phage terminase large subunit
MQIPVHFNPRDYQAEALRALEAGAVMNVWCWSRRGGKDFTAFGYAVKKMIEQPMNVVLVFPTKKQGYDNFWTNVENDGMKTLDHIPAGLIASQSNSPDNMKITLINGSTFTLLGASDPDALRGANAKLYIFSEFVDIDSAALDVIRPIIAVNGGQIIIQSTPKIDGISGGTFKILFDRAKKHPKQFASRITADRYLPQETLDDIREETIEKNGNDFWYQQEFMCNWGQASATTYYGQTLKKLEEKGKIGEYEYNRKYPVYTAWDLGGGSDSTAITFFQYYLVAGRPQVRIIDYYETATIGDRRIVNFLKTKPYVYGWHFLPHDATRRDPTEAIQRANKFRELGLHNSSVLTREPLDDGIKAAVTGIAGAVINKAFCGVLITKLYLYKRKFNPLTGDYVGPEHNTASHAADTVRYLYTAIEQEFDKETCEHFYSQVNNDDVELYEDELVTTNYYTPN